MHCDVKPKSKLLCVRAGFSEKQTKMSQVLTAMCCSVATKNMLVLLVSSPSALGLPISSLTLPTAPVHFSVDPPLWVHSRCARDIRWCKRAARPPTHGALYLVLQLPAIPAPGLCDSCRRACQNYCWVRVESPSPQRQNSGLSDCQISVIVLRGKHNYITGP